MRYCVYIRNYTLDYMMVAIKIMDVHTFTCLFNLLSLFTSTHLLLHETDGLEGNVKVQTKQITLYI